MDGQSSSGNESSLLLRKGQPDASTVVVMHQEVYADLRRAAVARLPGGTAGALLGNVQALGHQSWYTVREAAALDLEFSESGLTPERGSLERLRQRVDSQRWHELSVIGLFYADPEIGLFPARMDIGEIHRQLTPDASLLLLMNPSIDQGAFCLWREGTMLPVGGFYEALPEQSTSMIPWTGDWATMLIGAAGTLRRSQDSVRGRAGHRDRSEETVSAAPPAAEEPAEPPQFDMRASTRPEAAGEELEGDEAEQPELPEERMASEAVERITTLAKRLEAEGNLTGAVLLYRQALSLAPIIGDIALELRLRSTLRRLEEQVVLLEQDITQKRTAAWAEARARADKSPAASGSAGATQTAGRQRTAVDELFDIGLAAFWKGDLLHARNVLTEVVRQEPAYRTQQHRAANLLAGIERRLALPPPSSGAKAASEAEAAESAADSPGGPIRRIAMIALPVVAVALVILFAFSSFAPAPGPEPRLEPTPAPADMRPTAIVQALADPAAAVAEFVQENGGVARFGKPVSPLLPEATGGFTQTVQYYERGLLGFGGEGRGAADVSIFPLGKLELERRYPQGAPTPAVAAGDDLYFKDTGFAIAGAFREYWELPGNAQALGRPVSGVINEAAGDAEQWQVQYFEYGALRRRLVDPSAPVEAAPLGSERYQALHGSS